MVILPAIDLMAGQVVRLERGKADRKTVYSDDPVAFARKWRDEGAEYLHLVDLDAAFTGEQKNLESVAAVCAALDIPCELGGGLRDAAALEKAFAAGVSRVILGSKACESPEFVREAVRAFGGEKIAAGIDAKNGQVAVKGWVETSAWPATELAGTMAEAGVRTIIYTDIATDGMLAGPNLEAQAEMLETLGPDGPKLIASGGVGTLEHLEALSKLEGLYGAIVGKALYDGKVTLPACLSITR
jgi:phosphoribosylformimino-5-aminoimidazole carboxamide ribotide isomerase